MTRLTGAAGLFSHLLPMLLAAIFACALLTGCGDDVTSTTSSSAPGNEANAACNSGFAIDLQGNVTAQCGVSTSIGAQPSCSPHIASQSATNSLNAVAGSNTIDNQSLNTAVAATAPGSPDLSTSTGSNGVPVPAAAAIGVPGNVC